jgi:TP901 family phage tail tape measure protein
MAEEQIVTNIVAKSDFSNLIADLNKVSSALTNLQTKLNATNKNLSSQVNVMNRSFAEVMRSTGQYSTHFVSLASDVDKFGSQLDKGQVKLKQFAQVYQSHIKTSGGLVRQLAQQQVQLQNAILQPLGKNAEGLMQYNVHIPAGLDKIKNKSALAKQELQIMNKVIQEGANQMINWGKNTQWAGRQLTVGLTLPLAAFGKASADAFRQADQELVRLTKVYGGLAATSSQELGKVRQDVSKTAADLSKSYGSSFKDTIALAADIAATGKQGNELLGSIKETTRLSVLGEIDRQDAMKATLAIQTAFKQNTEQLSESINFLNAVENQTSTTLGDLVEAIPKAGPIVQGLGGDVKDLALYLTAMREGGISATEGANALKSGLASLINPTKVAKDMFSGFGISLTNIVEKNAGDTTATILELQKALETLNPLQKQQALEQLFGKFQFARMNALFENLGKQGSQTLAVMDLMKASSQDLANIAGRELSQVTESASGKYRRALEGLKADLAGVGEQFLTINTYIINAVDAVLKFVNKLPGPVKTVLSLFGGLTALAGPMIMLTGVLGNFFGYIIKGVSHMRALAKGGEGWKLLTPEILAANKAGGLVEQTFYSDAKASAILDQAIQRLSASYNRLAADASNAMIATNPMVSTLGGTPITLNKTPRSGNPKHSLIGGMDERAAAHGNPVGLMNQAQRSLQTIHSVTPNPIPVNRAIGKNPQIFSYQDMPNIPGLTNVGGVSTGIVAGEAAKWHSLMATLSMQTKQEVATLKKEIYTTGTVSQEFLGSYSTILPAMTQVIDNAVIESQKIIQQVEMGKLRVDQAQQKIIAINAKLEADMASTTAMMAQQMGRTANLTTVPLTGESVVDKAGKSNLRALFRDGRASKKMIDAIARATGVKTYGGGYSIETTIPKKFATGGTVVGGPRSDTTDTQFAYLNEGDFVLNRKASDALLGFNQGGQVPAMVTPGEIVVHNPTKEELAQLSAYNNQYAVGGKVTGLKNNYGLRGNKALGFIDRPQRRNSGSISNELYDTKQKSVDQILRENKAKTKFLKSQEGALSLLEERKTSIGAVKMVRQTSSGQQATSGATKFSTRTRKMPGVDYSKYSKDSFYNTKLGQELVALYGVGPTKKTPGSKKDSEVYIHVVHPDILNKHGMPTGRASTPDIKGVDLQKIGSGKINPNAIYRILPDFTVKGNQEFNEALVSGKATSKMWKDVQGGAFLDLAVMLHENGVRPEIIRRVLKNSAKNLNSNISSLGSNINESSFGTAVYDSVGSAIKTVKFNNGGLVGKNKNNYGVMGPAFKSQLFNRLGAGISKSSSHGGYDVNSLTLGMGKKLFGGSGLSPKAQNLMYNAMVENLQGSSPDGYVKTQQGKMFRGFVPGQANGMLFGAAMDVSRLPGISKKDREILAAWSSDPYKNNYSKGLLGKITGKMFGYNSGGVVGGRVRMGKNNYGIPGLNTSGLNQPPLIEQMGLQSPEQQPQRSSRGIFKTAGSTIGAGLLYSGVSYAGSSVGSKFGGTGGAIAGSILAPALLQGTISKLGAINKLGVSSSAIFTKLGPALLNPYVAAGVAVAALGVGLLKLKQRATEAGERNRLAFAGGVKPLEDFNGKIKDIRKSIEDARAARILLNTQFTSAGIPGLVVTAAQFKKVKDEIAKTSPKLVDLIKNTSTKDLLKVAIGLKAQYVAAGDSAAYANEKIAALLQLGDKGGMLAAILGGKGMSDITNAESAIKSMLNTLSGDWMGDSAQSVESMLQVFTSTDDYIGTQKDGAEALQKIFKDIHSSSSGNLKLSQEQVDKFKEMVPELGKILSTSDTIASTLAKWKIVTSGVTKDLSGLSNDQLEKLAEYATKVSAYYDKLSNVSSKEAQSNKVTGQLAKDIDKFNKQQAAASKSAITNIEDQISAKEKLIATIKKEADARKKALQDQQQIEDVKLQIQQEQLNYQNALAAGDMSSAAQSQINIQRLVGQQQLKSAENAIDDAAQKQIDALQAQIDALNKAVAAKSSQAPTVKTSPLQGQYERIVAFLKDVSLNNPTGNFTEEQLTSFNSMLTELQRTPGGQKYVDALSNNGPVSMVTDRSEGQNDKRTLLGTSQGSALTYDLKNAIDSNIQGAKIDTTNKILSDILLVLSKNKDITSTSAVVTTGTAGGVAYAYTSKKTLEKAGVDLAPGTLFTDKGGRTWKIKEVNGDNVNVESVSTPTPTTTPSGTTTPKTRDPGAGGKATGGFIRGAGTGTSDSIPTMLSNGEYVIRASAVQAVGTPTLDRINKMAAGGLAMKYDVPRMRMGGRVNYNNGSMGGVGSSSSLYNINVTLNGSNLDANDVARAIHNEMKMREITMGRNRII